MVVLLLLISHHSGHIFLPLTHSLSASGFNTTQHLLKSASARSAADERATGIEDKTGLSPCYYFDNDMIASVKGSEPEGKGSPWSSPLSVLTFDDFAETTWECVSFPEMLTLEKHPSEVDGDTI